jgi:pimeloyl-ACP methyl ester carboxylesterase
MKNIFLLLFFPVALQAQQYQVYPGEYDNWVHHPKSKRVYDIVANSSDPVAGLPVIADGKGSLPASPQASDAAQTGDGDSLVDVGGYKLHFVIYKGKGIPILFEAGGGEDATTWNKILRPIAERTGTTLITYDRAGFGQSTFDTTQPGIMSGMLGLEMGLQKLGYNGDIMLVAHSQGGLYAQLYAARHPDKVKAAVLIDVTTTCFYDEKRLAATQLMINQQNTDKVKASNPGRYYQGADFSDNIESVRKFAFPNTIPVTDLVSDHPPFQDSTDIHDWKRCHQEFAAASSNRTGILASGCGHFIFNDDPALVINAIVKAYNDARKALAGQ